MKSFELKVPPAVLVLLSGSMMWFIDRLTAQYKIDWSGQNVTVGLIVVVSFICIVSGIYSFNKAQTTVDPTQPNKASSLVTSGIYQWTRNPMYLGFLLLLLAFSFKLSNPVTIFILPLFIAYMSQFQIKPEERILAQLFGNNYDLYRKQVRRWI